MSLHRGMVRVEEVFTEDIIVRIPGSDYRGSVAIPKQALPEQYRDKVDAHSVFFLQLDYDAELPTHMPQWSTVDTFHTGQEAQAMEDEVERELGL